MKTRRGLWLLLPGSLVVIAAGGFIGFWVVTNVAARLLLQDQPMRVRLPPDLTVTVKTRNALDVLMQGDISAQVPLKQTIELPIDGTYDTDASLDTKVYLETVIRYQGVIPVDTLAEITAVVPVGYQNLKKYRNLKLKAYLPMKLRMPVNLTVPVKQYVRLKYQGPLRVGLQHTLRVPVDTTLRTTLKVNQVFKLPVTSSFGARMDIPEGSVAATIHRADLYLPLRTLRLTQAGPE